MSLPRFLLAVSLVMVILLAVMAWFLPSNDDFSVENPSWNGVQSLSPLVPALPLELLSQLPPSPQGAALILIPYLPFSQAELEVLAEFVGGGGSLFLADDYGYGNQVLEYLGLSVRFSGSALLDPLVCYKNQWLPRILRLTSSPVTTDVDSLVFNHATSLSHVAEDDILARSSSFSFLDIDGDQKWDEGEPKGPLPVISSHQLSSGQVIVIADPSIFINSMAALDGNQRFIENISAITSGGLYIDQSRLPPSNLHEAKKLLSGFHDFAVTPLGTLGLVIVPLLVIPVLLWPGRNKKADGQMLGKGDTNDNGKG